ncbi:MAG: phosphoenolpyruvate--protein phosphotransferase [Lachnospiraceae bacterium]|nr:phosphoenolpyruvate--protein phosphotransferase [Lachnospiraceae bacterium]
MITIKGKSSSKGIAIGRLVKYVKPEATVKREKVSDVEAEVARYETARDTAKEQLQKLYDKALKEVGESGAAIFEVHQMMLEDEDYNDSIYNMIRTDAVNAEFAVAKTGENFSEMFAGMDDEYFAARATDVKDISERIVSVLAGVAGSLDMSEPVILMAEDLAPSETVQMDKSKLLAFVTRLGSANSHTAILARTMGIPSMVEVDIQDDWDGKMTIVDGNTATIYIDPTEEVMVKMEALKAEETKQKQLLLELKGKENVTLDGTKVNLYANIGNVGDVAAVLANDAGGIGLFRSEFLYLGTDNYPSEEDQFNAYRTVAQNMAGKKVIIRTLDIGADKQVDYFQLDKEDNPAMGLRAIRICLERPAIFKTQLRALLRASAFGNISIMFPMIISVEEVKKIKGILEEVKAELREANVAFKEDIEIGIMIETPASVMISDLLAEEVDFFSIGTNDLTQYTLAIDRQNAKLEPFYNPHHEAILRMINMVIQNGHKGGAWVGICGELGADPELTRRFMEMGIDELSVSPSLILGLRKSIREMDLKG